jgi:hypothetical protein
MTSGFANNDVLAATAYVDQTGESKVFNDLLFHLRVCNPQIQSVE